MISSEAKTLTLRRRVDLRRLGGTTWRRNVSVFASLGRCAPFGPALLRVTRSPAEVGSCGRERDARAKRLPNYALHRTVARSAFQLEPRRAAGERRR